MNINFANSNLFSQYNLISQLFGGKGKPADMAGAGSPQVMRIAAELADKPAPGALLWEKEGIYR